MVDLSADLTAAKSDNYSVASSVILTVAPKARSWAGLSVAPTGDLTAALLADLKAGSMAECWAVTKADLTDDRSAAQMGGTKADLTAYSMVVMTACSMVVK